MSLWKNLQPDWPMVNRLLDQALELPFDQRAGWLETLQGDEAMFKDRLRQLLGATAAANDHLPESLNESRNDSLVHALQRGPALAGMGEPAVGDTVGPWRLLALLGEGGMGSVWRAQRTDASFKREVALKLPRLSWARGLAQRLERERDILATLEHPGISRLYEAGVDALGRPWLALERVPGQPIDRHCSDAALSTRQRVALLVQVCEAVAYAHSRLVIHRDLKPSNILVDGDGQARLLDFGIARLLAAPTASVDAPPAGLTELAGTPLTPGYASPEQLREEPLTTASDVFSLGVVSYELLTGRLPCGERPSSVAAYERALAAGAPPLASRVAADPAAAAALRGDLEAVLDRALQNSVSTRYTQAEALAAELRAWLRGEAVSARRRSWREQLLRWVGRHHIAVACAGLAVVGLVGGSAVAVQQALRANAQARQAAVEADNARKEAARARATQTLLRDIFSLNSIDQPEPQRAQRTTVRELLDISARSVTEVMKDTPDAQAEMLGTLSGLYAQLGVGGHATALARDRAALVRRALPDDDPQRAEALLALSGFLHDTPERAAAQALVDEAAEVLDRAGPRGAPLQPALALQRARHERWGSLQAAVVHADKAVRLYRERRPDDAARSSALYFAAVIHQLAGNLEQAAVLTAEARGIGLARGERGLRAMLAGSTELGDLLAERGLWAEADEAHAQALVLAQRALAPDHRTTLVLMAQRARFLVASGRIDDGDRLWAQAQRLATARQPPFEPWWLDYLATLMSREELERGRPDLAEPRLRAAVDSLRDSVPQSAVAANRLLLLAQARLALGDTEHGERMLTEAEVVWARISAGLPAAGLGNRFALVRAQAQLARGEAAAALALLQSLPPTPGLAAGGVDRDGARRWVLLSTALLQSGRAADAAAAARWAIDEIQRLPVPYRWPALQADAALALGQALAADGQARPARAALAQAVALRRANDLPASRWLLQAELAQAALGRGR